MARRRRASWTRPVIPIDFLVPAGILTSVSLALILKRRFFGGWPRLLLVAVALVAAAQIVAHLHPALSAIGNAGHRIFLRLPVP